jgi:autotransporter family porin
MRLYFRGRMVRSVSRYTGRKVVSRRRLTLRPDFIARLKQADRASLLVSTALASTLVIGTLFAPTHALAQTTTCTGGPGPGPTPILEATTAPIICVNTDDRTSNGTSPDAINLSTTGNANYITLYNSGILTAVDDGIDTSTTGNNSFITIENVGAITAGDDGISATTNGDSSSINITNSGFLDATFGIYTHTYGSNSAATVTNSGDINASYVGILALADGNNNDVTVTNTGDIVAQGAPRAAGIVVDTYADDGDITITNSGDITADYAGIVSYAGGSGSDNQVENSGNIFSGVYGIAAITVGDGSNVDVQNSRYIDAGTFGIYALTVGNDSATKIENSGNITAGGTGIFAQAYGNANGAYSNASIEIDNSGDIVSNGTVNAGAIYVATLGDANGAYSNTGIDIDNAGDLTAERAGIVAGTFGDANGAGSNAGIEIDNAGAIASGYYGIYAVTKGSANGAYSNVGIDIENWGDITSGGSGIFAQTFGSATGFASNAGIHIDNEADITAGDFGIEAQTFGANAGVTIDNDGDITAALNDPVDPPSAADGIYAFTAGPNSPIHIENEGNITVYGAFVPLPPPYSDQSAGVYDAMYAVSVGGHSGITVVNSGHLTTNYGEVIDIRTYGGVADPPIPPDQPVPDNLKVGPTYSPVTVINFGDIDSGDDGIEICTAGLRNTNCRGGGGNSPVLVKNYGHINANYVDIDAVTYGPNSPITFYNFGDAVAGEESLDSETSGDNSPILIVNYGNLNAGIDGISGATSAYAQGDDSPITIRNYGDITAGEVGIYASTGQNFPSNGSPIDIFTSGTVVAAYDGIYAHTDGEDSPISIVNAGSLTGGDVGDERDFAGIYAVTEGDDISIVNTGSISAVSGLAIDTEGGATEIVNEGLITGRVDLTEEDDSFDNSGTFEARGESDFGDGDDVFSNSGVVHAIGETSFVNLEVFENAGLISMVNGSPRDVFTIEGPVAFSALSGSRLAVDAKLGGAGSKADLLVIDGDVDGKTRVSVNNAGGAGAFNKAGIPVVEVTGSVGPKDFVLKGGPVDAGFFRYDLFFEPGDPNVFELRSAIGQNAFVLPQLTTAMQDLWHSTSDTWFDRTADLRVALYGVPGMAALPASSKLEAAGPAPGYQTIYPGLWARGSFGELNRDASVSFSSFGPTTAHLNRDQRTGDFQAGVDFGTRDLLGPGDALIFGVLGGFVVSELDYDQLAQSFDLNGGQVGAYATYLNGGLFLDTLFKADFVDLDPKSTVGFAGSLDAQNFGVRLDSGYRFGGFGPGMFFEPLATIGVVDSEIDNFTQGGNRVNFDDGTSVRGRLGLRLGASMKAGAMTVEPFVIGSIWHEFEDDNRTALVSSGTLFSLADNFQDTWGEVSAGINLFNLGAGASGFGKVDVVFGDDIDGVGGQLGVRYKW